MPALLYVLIATSICAALVRVAGVSRLTALALVLLPLFVTGRALLSGRVYGPLDLGYATEPLASLAESVGVTHVMDPTASDQFAEFIPWHAAVRHAWSNGEWPLWNPFETCGTILAAAVQSAPFHPLHVVALILPLPGALTFIATMLFFLAAVSAFLFLEPLVRNDAAGLVGAAAWMFCTHMVSLAGTAHGLALATAPLALLGARAAARTPGVRSALVLAGALVLMVLAGHPETMLHLSAIATAYFFFELSGTERRGWKSAFATGAAAAALALLLSAISLLPFLDALPQTSELRYRRTTFGARATDASRVIRRVTSELLPFIGGTEAIEVPRNDARERERYGSAYAGALVLALALYALWKSTDRRRWFFAGLLVFAMLAGASTPVLIDLLLRLPLFSIAVNEWMIWSGALALSVLAGIGVDTWLTRLRAGRDGASLAAVLMASAFIAGFGILALAPQLTSEGLSPAYIRVNTARALLPLLLASAAALTLRSPRIAGATILALVLLQRAGESQHSRPSIERGAFYPPFPGLDLMRLRARPPFRVAPLGSTLTPNTSVHYELEDVRGFPGMTLARFEDLMPAWCVRQDVWSNRVDDLSSPFLSLMNVRFSLTFPQWTLPAAWKRIASFNGYDVAENTAALERAFVPLTVHTGVSDSESLRAVYHCRDFAREAWIETGQRMTLPNGPGTIVVERRGTGLRLHANMAGGGWVVISETAWAGWRARTGTGQELPLRYANHAFLGLYLPQGKHEVELDYRPRSFAVGASISAATLGLLFLITGITRFRARS